MSTNRSELSDEEHAEVQKQAEKLVGEWIRDTRGRVWKVTETDLKDGWATVGGGYYWARPEECTVIDVAAELASIERLRASDQGEARKVEQAAVQACSNLAEYLNAEESWNGGDVCEVLAQELRKAGYAVEG